ncbi:MAG: TSUP family transporter, partial [Planctomycetales bacterium]
MLGADFTQLLMVAAIGGAVGFLSGLFGVGGGFLMVPALTIFAGVELKVAVGISVCQMLGSSTTGLLHRCDRGQLQLQMPLTMAGGVMVGLWWGF